MKLFTFYEDLDSKEKEIFISTTRTKNGYGIFYWQTDENYNPIKFDIRNPIIPASYFCNDKEQVEQFDGSTKIKKVESPIPYRNLIIGLFSPLGKTFISTYKMWQGK